MKFTGHVCISAIIRFASVAVMMFSSTYCVCAASENPEDGGTGNIQAVLADAITSSAQEALVEGVLNQKVLTQSVYLSRFYLHRAVSKVGLDNRLVGLMVPWEDMLKQGLTTCAEEPLNPRSDCHAASAFPPYDFLSTLCGICPAEPRFKSVRIAPSLGTLKWIQGAMPHPDGEIAVDMRRSKLGVLRAKIVLPPELSGVFVWQAKTYPIQSGRQDFAIGTELDST